MITFREIVLCHLVLHSVLSAIVNVARNQPSWQSSTDYQWNASRANDGNNDNQESMDDNSCSHTNASGYNISWWQVDLGKMYLVSHILITTREWVGDPGRLAGFSVYVSQSNKHTWLNHELCFYDSNPQTSISISRRIDCTNSIYGRYVVVYNKRPVENGVHNFPYSINAILVLCEVEVPIQIDQCADNLCTYCIPRWYGDRCGLSCANCLGSQGCQKESGNCIVPQCRPGYYGPKCTDICSTNCLNKECYFGNGDCIQCNDPYYGLSCDQICPQNCKACTSQNDCSTCKSYWYGQSCSLSCSKCGGNGSCDKITGECLAQLCIDGFYGTYCNMSCSTNCVGDMSCEFATGKCKFCQDGRYGNTCEYFCPTNCRNCEDETKCGSCSNGYYGTACGQSCHGCGGNSSCWKSNGVCTFPYCKSTYYSNNGKCDQPCPSTCAGDTSCNDTNGECTHGCSKGFHGFKCSQTCPEKCRDGTCYKRSGLCSDGCMPGWNGTECDSACTFPKFGQDCNQDCGHCKSVTCHHINGTCMQGCEDGWKPPLCKVRALAIDESSGVSTAVVGGAVGTLLGVILVVIIVIVVIKRSRSTKKESGSSSSNVYLQSQEPGPVPTSNAMYTNIMSVEEEKRSSKPQFLSPKPKVSQSVPAQNADESDRTYHNSVNIKREVEVSEFKAYVTRGRSTGKYEDEFQAIPYGALHPTTEAEIPKNMKKNRFKTTFPYDHSRVVLKGKADYINANFIEDTNGVKKYIATQGPLPNTTEDFWHMVWEYNVDIIVMLTNLREGKKIKCVQYWPNPNEKMTHGQFGLSLLDERHFSYYSLRELEVVETKSKQSRKVLQYHFTTWPDHGTPDPLFLVLFHKRVISKAPKYDGPILVHCSAGIGRTGTFIALDALESQGNNTGAVDIENYVRIMRKDRMNMIQTSEQYKVLHEALVEAFQWQDTYISMDDFPSVWQSIETDKRPLNQQRLKKEYDMLREMKGDSENPVSAIKEENKAKNRTDSILPLDKHRPYLSSYFAGGNDFINSVIIPSHLAKDGFMVTQVPLQGTIVDFWRLITDHDSRCIVYFAQSSDEETNFYPSHEDVTDTEMHNVKKESSNTLQEGVEEVKMKVKGKKSNQTKDVTLLKIDMAGKNYPTGAQIFRAVEIVELQRNRNKNSPCTVVSLDGGTPCEVFCAISNILEYMKVDNRIDVFQTARQLQIRRPEFFETFETYRYCYQMINEYLMTQSVYFNM